MGAQLFLATTRVAQAGAERGVEVEIGDDQVLLELPAAGDRFAELVDDEAAAVEDQLVLAADHVDVGERDHVVGGPGRHHALAVAALAAVIGRAVDRDHQLGPGQRLDRGRPRLVPEVLADVHREGRLTQREYRRLRPGLEVAVLVEHPVVRQVVLVIHAGDPPVVDHRGRVEDVVPPVDEADDRRQPSRGPDHLVERAQVRLDERGLEEQILGRIAGNGQLGKCHEPDAPLPRPLDVVHDLADVPLEVPNCRVHLSEPDPQRLHDAIILLRGIVLV